MKTRHAESVRDTHCLFGSREPYVLARTKGLKVEPEGQVGKGGKEVTDEDNNEDLVDINDGLWQSCAGQSNERQGKDIYLSVREYHKWTVGGLSCIFVEVYIHLGCTQTMVCAHNK